MNRTISTLSLITGTILLLAFTKPLKDETFKVDTERSSIEWTGRKVTGQHTGTIKLSSGELTFNGNALKNGSFIIDMATMTCIEDGKPNTRLMQHLNSDDFLSVEKNPNSKFQITKVSPAGTDRLNITGNLTIKGITEPLTFPATVKRQGNAVVAVAKGVKVDRTKYDIKFRSKNFFGDIGDKAIEDDFELDINLVARK